MGMAIDANAVYVTDASSQRIIHYGRTGTPLRTFGRKGRGPGEFAMIGYPAAASHVVLALDDSRRVAVAFDRTGGELLWEAPFEGTANAVAPRGDTVWFSLTNTARNTVAGRFTLTDRQLQPISGLPQVMRESPPFAAIHAMSQVLVSGDTLYLGLSGVDSLVAMGLNAPSRESIKIPAKHRRAMAEDAIAGFFNKPRPFEELFQASSFFFGLQRLSDGRFAALHFDQDRKDRGITSNPYLSVISADRRQACVDGSVPLTSDSRMVPAFRGDTLMILSQSAVNASVRTVVYAYTIRTDRCHWIGVDH
jgi:hypothetical protein